MKSKIVDHDPEPATLDDLRLLIKEIKKFRQMGDTNILPEARAVLLRVLHASGKRLLRTHRLQTTRARADRNSS